MTTTPSTGPLAAVLRTLTPGQLAVLALAILGTGAASGTAATAGRYIAPSADDHLLAEVREIADDCDQVAGDCDQVAEELDLHRSRNGHPWAVDKLGDVVAEQREHREVLQELREDQIRICVALNVTGCGDR